jgi:hypothetical protein
MPLVVINRCPRGDALLSDAGLAEYAKRKGIAVEGLSEENIARDDPVLVEMVQDRDNLDALRSHCAQLKVIDIPEGMKWEIRRRGNVERIAALP